MKGRALQLLPKGCICLFYFGFIVLLPLPSNVTSSETLGCALPLIRGYGGLLESFTNVP